MLLTFLRCGTVGFVVTRVLVVKGAGGDIDRNRNVNSRAVVPETKEIRDNRVGHKGVKTYGGRHAG